MEFEDEDYYSEDFSDEMAVAKAYNPNGKSYPLKLQVREPTPEDLIKANEKGTVNSEDEVFKFTPLTKQEADHLDKR